MEVMNSRLPPWFKKKMPDPVAMAGMRDILDDLKLNTVCEHAHCPNIGECFQSKTATFLIMGNICTRNCTFCAVKKGIARPLDADEPLRVADAVRSLGLEYIVLTSVTRDDLPDGGACHFALTIAELRGQGQRISVEVLIPDFGGEVSSIATIVDTHPNVINHNLETVHRLYPNVRPKADYQRSLQLLAKVKNMDSSIITKSGLMVGLGETRDELFETMEDLRGVGCDLLTIGQYLKPSSAHYPVDKYIPPEEFQEYESIAESMGFLGVACAPLVRSSYKAGQLYFNAIEKVRVS